MNPCRSVLFTLLVLAAGACSHHHHPDEARLAVTTRDGRRIEGRLVFDLDESETTETLDAPSNGIDYTLPFGLVSTIDLHAGAPRASVTLHSGEQLQLNLSGDLGSNNAGMLIFTSDAKQPEYVRWSNVAQIQLDRPPAMYPPFNKP
ncbi:MAG: hypothetical protein IH602_19405 [Bryobacteraceae bacterium]|nr:hypothetical protein [Bryobacteraceae bacterium]